MKGSPLLEYTPSARQLPQYSVGKSIIFINLDRKRQPMALRAQSQQVKRIGR